VAGKTGTAEYTGPRDASGQLPTHGWFTGFAPIEDPEISVTVFIEKGTGSKNAAPIAVKIIRNYFKIDENIAPVPVSATPATASTPAPIRQSPIP
jgi:cell division protein FtsI/penicillin-binding protein 2